MLTAWLAQPERGATYRFASGRENEAPLLRPKDAECPIEAATYPLARIAEEDPGSRSAYVNRRPIFILINQKSWQRNNEVIQLFYILDYF